MNDPTSCCPDVSPAWPGGDLVTIGVPVEVRVAGYAEPSEFDSDRGTASVYLTSIGESPIQVLVTVVTSRGYTAASTHRDGRADPLQLVECRPGKESDRFRSGHCSLGRPTHVCRTLRRELERVGATVSVR